MIRVVIADDHRLVRAGLKHVVADHKNIAFAGELCIGAELAQKLREQKFDVGLLDMFMPGRSGVDRVRLVRSAR